MEQCWCRHSSHQRITAPQPTALIQHSPNSSSSHTAPPVPSLSSEGAPRPQGCAESSTDLQGQHFPEQGTALACGTHGQQPGEAMPSSSTANTPRTSGSWGLKAFTDGKQALATSSSASLPYKKLYFFSVPAMSPSQQLLFNSSTTSNLILIPSERYSGLFPCNAILSKTCIPCISPCPGAGTS